MSFDEMLREPFTPKEVTAVCKRLGKMDMVVETLHFRSHVDRWCKASCNNDDRNELLGVSVCLCVRLYIDIVSLFFSFFGGVGGVRRYDCKGNRRNSTNTSMS